jgi:hypothetical protein
MAREHTNLQRGRGFECATLHAGQIPTQQPDAPRILGSAPFDGRVQHIVARLAQTIVRVPHKSTVVVIAQDEVETSCGFENAPSIFWRKPNRFGFVSTCVIQCIRSRQAIVKTSKLGHLRTARMRGIAR